MPEMSPPDVETFLRETRIAKLAYLHANGQPTIVPIWFEWDGAVARMFTSRTSRKARRFAEDSRVALSVEEPAGVHERWVTIEGTVAIGDEGAVPLIERLTRRYYEQPKAEQTIRSWTASPEMWVVLTLTPKRIRSSA